MYFAKIKCGNDCDSYLIYTYGSLASIASTLKEESENAFNIESEWELKDFEEEYYCEFDDYRSLRRKKKNFPEELIRSYSFVLSDMYTYTSSLESTAEGVKSMIEEFADGQYVFDSINPSEEEIFEAMQDICDNYDSFSYYQIDCSKLRHLKEKED